MIIAIANWFAQMGLSTRVLNHMLEDTLVSDSSGRDVIFDKIYIMIQENPFGYGVLGEWKYLNWNTHNFYLQLLVHFGIVGGILILGFVIMLLIRALHKNVNPFMQDFIVMWACVLLIRGFAGGSYLSYYFPFLIGLCMQVLRKKKYM